MLENRGSRICVATLIAKLCGFVGGISWDASKLDGQPRRMLDTSKAYEEIGFKIETPLEIGLRNTIDWYRKSPGEDVVSTDA